MCEFVCELVNTVIKINKRHDYDPHTHTHKHTFFALVKSTIKILENSGVA